MQVSLFLIAEFSFDSRHFFVAQQQILHQVGHQLFTFLRQQLLGSLCRMQLGVWRSHRYLLFP
tara:strand:+ start:715 stop:903 length:189 start_codon:yes stop_codon:yes gene_type:complete